MDNQMNQYDNGGGYNNGNRGNMPGGNNNGNGGGGNNGSDPRRPNILTMVLAAMSTLVIVWLLYSVMLGGGADAEEVSYTQFLQELESDNVNTVKLQSTGEVIFTLKSDAAAANETATQIPLQGYGDRKSVV